MAISEKGGVCISLVGKQPTLHNQKGNVRFHAIPRQSAKQRELIINVLLPLLLFYCYYYPLIAFIVVKKNSELDKRPHYQV